MKQKLDRSKFLPIKTKSLEMGTSIDGQMGSPTQHGMALLWHDLFAAQPIPPWACQRAARCAALMAQARPEGNRIVPSRASEHDEPRQPTGPWELEWWPKRRGRAAVAVSGGFAAG